MGFIFYWLEMTMNRYTHECITSSSRDKLKSGKEDME